MRRLPALAAALLALWLAIPAPAQDTPPGIGRDNAPIDYEAWRDLATRAEKAVLEARASTGVFEQLRGEIADWRARFRDASDQNASRIATLEEQLAALGPAPDAEGESVTPEIAQRRGELAEQLERLRAPGRRAQEAFTRADGLITEIDAIIRARQANALTRLGPTPLNPAHWPGALDAIQRIANAVMQETNAAWNRPVSRARLGRNLPVIAAYLLAAGVLLLRGRRWMERLTLRLAGDPSRRGRSGLVAAISLGQIVLPYLGILALTEAAEASAMLGLRGGAVVSDLPRAGLVVLIALWLGGRVFPKSGREPRLFTLDPDDEARGRRAVAALGIVMAATILLRAIIELERLDAEVQAVLRFPLIVLGALFLFRIGRILRRQDGSRTPEGDGRAFDRVLVGVGQVTMALALAAPVAGAIGYMPLAAFLTYPVMQTLALLALLLLIERLLVTLQSLTLGGRDARDTLFPVLAAFILTLAALPVIALIWGARVADLTEIWARVNAGFALGETRISPTDFLSFLIVLVLGVMATRLVQGVLRSNVLPKTRIEKGGQTALVSGLGYLGISLAAIVAITSTGVDLSSLAIVAGALSVGIGFGLQNIVSNFVSGIILLIERPIAEGDWIEIPGAQMGTVRTISVRSTRIETFDRVEVIIPNSDLVSGSVINWTRGNALGRLIVPVHVPYGADTRRVEAILTDIARAHPLVMIVPEPQILFMGFGDSALNFEMRVILSDVNFIMDVRSDLNHEIARCFGEEGIAIPVPRRDIWLRGGAAAPDTEGWVSA